MIRVAIIDRSIRNDWIATAVFVFLNVADAWLTSCLLAKDGVEAFWWSSAYNSNMIIKGLLALLIALVLTRLGKASLLKWLNIAMLLVVLANGLCFLGYLGSWLYWHNRIVKPR